MVRSSIRLLCLLLVARAGLVEAQQPSPLTAYHLLPDTTQAVLWIPNSTELSEQWEKTQLASLASDAAIKPFFDDQRQALESRFLDAGWRLNIKPKDLAGVVDGQIALAWMERPEPRKPYAMALVAEITNENKQLDGLFTNLDRHLKERNAQKATLNFNRLTINKYTLPPRAGELLPQDVFYTVAGSLLISTDDEQLIKDIISRSEGTSTGTVLADDRDFIQSRQEMGISDGSHAQYFVRPLGFARVLRSIGGKRSRSASDMLAALHNQGFGEIRCVCGEVSIALEDADILHRGFVLAAQPLPKSAALLDFPNKANRAVPSFVTKDVSSFLSTYWNSQEAFWKAEGLVDELAGSEGMFQAMIDGIRDDPKGSQVDIEKEVLPQFSNEIFAITDIQDPISIESRRNLIALRIKDAKALGMVLNRAMSNEPDAEMLTVSGLEIWKVTHQEDDDLADISIGQDFGEFGTTPALEDEEEPWLSNWAITVFSEGASDSGYLMFASHVEMIEQAVANAKASTDSELVNESDYQHIVGVLEKHFGEGPLCGWHIMRPDRAYRAQYELFRQGKLQQSESMLASILDRLLQNKSEIRSGQEQVIDGSRLPPFSVIARYLQPSGINIVTTPKGWSFGGVLLSASPRPKPAVAIERQSGTARVGTGDRENLK
ncbi:MAG: DUF3352 domain-containing protein [Planctomycetales bacterium]|nr:DUF3352 domain-containing protein [Planctomycetales bacterium]